jgi:8-oxo-dGTP pyrophosphatase MutT (NUDIX family)
MRNLIERSLLLPSELIRGDHDLNPGQRPPDQPLKPAAVLVPIVDREDGMTVLLTKRTEHLNDHAGQVSFPGGRAEPEDADAVATALREAEEEIGLGRAFVDILGRLDTYITGTGYSVTPVVGIVRPGFTLTIDPYEVAEAFEVPLAFLLDEKNHERHSREYRGTVRHFWAMPYNDYFIWGATAGMLRNLYNRVQQPDPMTGP